MTTRAHNETLSRFDRLQIRAFDVLAKYWPCELIYNGKKAKVISSSIGNEYVQELVGYLPKRSASVEIKLTDLRRLGCTNESYVALDGVVLRLRQLPQDDADISLKFYAHSTPDQGAPAATAAQEESGSVALAIGQVEVFVPFASRKSTTNYVFAVLEIENTVDANPFFIGIVPTAHTDQTFTLLLAAAPDTANYVLKWKVIL
jgi:hypothetical protein